MVIVLAIKKGTPSLLLLTTPFLLSLDQYQGFISIDQEKKTATFKAGTKLSVLNQLLHQEGLALENLSVQIPVCLDIDLSQNYPGLRFGVCRSQVENEKTLLAFLTTLKKTKYIRLDGLMGYEAQIAGLGDFANGNFILDGIVRLLKQRALSKISPWRQKAVSIIQDQDFSLQFINGGGTGSLETTSKVVVTEVTVGSGFFCPHLFDHYQNFKLHPALFYGLQIVRRPQKNIFTGHGGGVIASGGIDKKKEPIVHLPAGGQLDTNEGAGEVQTPIFFKDSEVALEIGDPVFLRHAKSGELCERFNKLVVLDGGEKEVLTYRGLRQSFG